MTDHVVPAPGGRRAVAPRRAPAAAAAGRGVPLPALIVFGCLVLLAASVAAGGGEAKLLSFVLVGVSLIAAAQPVLARWTVPLGVILLVILLIPIDRYEIPGGLPFQIEPYRVLVALLIAGWLGSLLVDPFVSARRTGFEGPLLLIVIATVGSEFVNPGRVANVSGYVVKALWFFVTFVAVVYVIVSVVRTRGMLDKLITVLVVGAGIVGGAAVVQRAAHVNIFDHVRAIIPFLSYHPVATDTRNGAIRAVSSAGHPIELSVVMSMLLPLAAYVAFCRRRAIWWGACGLILLGDLSTGSRSGVIGLLAALAVLIWLRPRQVLRFWPAIIPTLLVVHIAVPGALGGIKAGFFPTGGLVAEQQHTVSGAASAQLDNNRLADWGPSFQEYRSHNPLFGEGFGTRVTGFGAKDLNAAILDDQWLKTFLETGVLGLLGWAWLLARTIRRLGARAKLERQTAEGWLPVALAAAAAAFGATMATYDAFSFIQGTFLIYATVGLGAALLLLPPAVAMPRRGASDRLA